MIPPATFTATESEEIYGYIQLGEAVHFSSASKNTEASALTSFTVKSEDGTVISGNGSFNIYTVDDPKAVHIEIAEDYLGAGWVGTHFFTVEEIDVKDADNKATTKIIYEVLECIPEWAFTASSFVD